MSEFPTELKYASSHEWARLESDGSVVIGITDHAQDALGDVVYIELPEMGASVDAGSEVAVIESVKAASDIYAPVNGTVIDANGELADNPELVNTDPYGEGWIFKIQPDEIEDVTDMMDPDEYEAYASAED